MNVSHVNLELVFTSPHVLHLLGSLFHHQGLVALVSIDHGPPEELPSGVLKTWAYHLSWIVNDSLHVSHGERLAQKRWKITYWCAFLWWERKKRAWFYGPDAEEEEMVAQKRMVLRSSGTFCLTWAGWLRLQHFAHCTWSLCFRYSVRAAGSWVYGWYRLARAWEISQAYEVFKGDLYVLCLQD